MGRYWEAYVFYASYKIQLIDRKDDTTAAAMEKKISVIFYLTSKIWPDGSLGPYCPPETLSKDYSQKVTVALSVTKLFWLLIVS